MRPAVDLGHREATRRPLAGRLGVLLAVLVLTVYGAAARSRSPVVSLPVPAEDAPVRLLITGGQSGRLEPCGCTTPQRGGLVAWAGLLGRLRADSGVAPVPVQLGPALERTDRRLDALEAAVVAEAWDLLGVTCLHAAGADLEWLARRAGADSSSDEGSAWGRARVPANVLLAADLGPPLERPDPWSSPAPAVRVAHLVGEREAGRLQASGVLEAWSPPAVAARALVEEDPDRLWVIGVAGEPDDVRAVREAVRGGTAVVVHVGATATRVAPDVGEPGLVTAGDGSMRLLPVTCSSRNARRHGRLEQAAPLLSLGRRGVDALELVVHRAGGGFRVTARVHPLHAVARADVRPLVRRVREVVERHHRAVGEAGLLSEIPRLPARAAVGTGRAPYVGSASCAACHAGHQRDWSGTAHAHALDTLAASGRARDPECVVCHTTGFERTAAGEFVAAAGGYRDAGATPELAGVGCESCHGPGGDHVASPADRERARRGGFRFAPTLRDCVDCHDPDNSPAFARSGRSRYLPRVDHRRLDAEPARPR